MFRHHDDDSLFPWTFGSDFPLLRWKLEGRQLAPVYADRRVVGQTGMSVFVTSEIAGAELPGPYADHQVLAALEALADELRIEGFCLEACVFQGTSNGILPGSNRQVALWNNVLEIAAVRSWMTVSLSKEEFKQVLPWDRLRKPAAQSWDGGAFPDDNLPNPTRLRYAGSHAAFQAPRDDDWPRRTKSAFDVTAATGLGCCVVEPMGADETNQQGKRSNVADDFYWSAAISRLLSLGSYFHSQAGTTSAPFGPAQKACALAHFKALSDIPCDAQLGRYAKAVPGGTPVETFDELRTYGSLLSDAEQWVVVCRPGPRYPRNGSLIAPRMLHGWRLVEQHGPMGTALRVIR